MLENRSLHMVFFHPDDLQDTAKPRHKCQERNQDRREAAYFAIETCIATKSSHINILIS